jgi:hypothetical protein
MSHHVQASASNPTGAVEVVRVSNPATTAAPVDTGSATAATATPGAASAASTTPVSSVVSGQAPTTGQSSGLPGANLPVEDIQQASNTMQNAQADLSVTAGAERRLDRFDLVGGGGGGEGGGGEGAGQENANNAEGAVAQDNPDVNQLENQRVDGETAVTSQPDVNPGTNAVATGLEQDLRSVNEPGSSTVTT